MLNIPDAIKALYLADGRPDIRKNFRVRFPNGELPDINADQILTESVKLDESIMSQNTFRFGLAEAPQISFETIGVPNMMGMTIACFHEIEITGLSAADLAAVQSDPGDGSVALAADSDLGFSFYRLPLGVFIVDKCPRNRGAMTHRRVTARGVKGGAAYNPAQAGVQAMQTYVTTYKMSLWALLSVLLNPSGESGLVSMGWVKGTGPASSGLVTARIKTWTLANAGGTAITYELDARSASYNLNRSGAEYAGESIITEVIAHDSIDAEVTAVINDMKARGVDPVQSGFADWDALAADVRAVFSREYHNGTHAVATIFTGYGVYPTFYHFSGANNVVLPLQTSIYYITELRGNSTVIYTADPAEVYSFTDGGNHPFAGMFVEYKPTAQTQLVGSATLNVYSYADIYDQNALVVSALELSGHFARCARDGSYALIALDNSAPTLYDPGKYSDVWFDEYDISGIGSVILSFDTSEGAQEMQLEVGDGDSIYEMIGSAVFNGLSPEPSVDDALTILQTEFVPQMGAIKFTPIEFDAKGLPWIEAGDAITITTDDGETVQSYVLERTLSGIQSLRDDIGATGGDLISVEAAGYGA